MTFSSFGAVIIYPSAKFTLCWDLVSDEIWEDTFLKYFSDGVARGYVQYNIFIVLWLLVSVVIGWFHALYRKFYTRTNYSIKYLLVPTIIHSTASPVFLCPHKFIISCFYHLINFLANFWHLTEHRRTSNVYTIISPCYPLLIWEISIYYFHDVIIMINTETKRRLKNPKIQVLKERPFLHFNPKKNLSKKYS